MEGDEVAHDRCQNDGPKVESENLVDKPEQSGHAGMRYARVTKKGEDRDGLAGPGLACNCSGRTVPESLPKCRYQRAERRWEGMAGGSTSEVLVALRIGASNCKAFPNRGQLLGL